MEIEGSAGLLDRFKRELKNNPPPMSVIDRIEIEQMSPAGDSGFEILNSESGDRAQTSISPDIATCDECLEELNDAGSRRYGYAFINCTNCGPRYTITTRMPYDRAVTSMNEFPMCSGCAAEYEDIDRRWYHAQPIACPRCGPELSLLDREHNRIKSGNIIESTIRLLEQGNIIAIKGLGGFHLACNAASEEAVSNLRRRKHRPEKPFAVMAADLDAVLKFASPGPLQKELLASWRRPVVLVEKNDSTILARSISFSSPFVGVMLPYTPLHHMIMDGVFPALVMTSGNVSDDPVIHDNDEAVRLLSDVADCFILNNRRIIHRADDSVMTTASEDRMILRRSRGFVPSPLRLPGSGPSVLALGGDLKNTCCVTKGTNAFMSQHIGDLGSIRTLHFLEEVIASITELHDVRPELLVHDLHPDYYSTHHAMSMEGINRMPVQHHHAHALSCLAENGHDGPAIAICLDGTGYGTDGNIWGGEILHVDGLNFSREARFKYMVLPGGQMAVREPWRMAVSVLMDAAGAENFGRYRKLAPFNSADSRALDGVISITDAAGAGVLCSSAGRLLDAASSLLGLCQKNTYEGQAAMALEYAAMKSDKTESFEYRIHEGTETGPETVINYAPTIRQLADSVLMGEETATTARRIHNTLIASAADAVSMVRDRTGTCTVALSGGVFQNRLLHTGLKRVLNERNFRVLVHSRIPPNDGGVSLGQAWAGVLSLSS